MRRNGAERRGAAASRAEAEARLRAYYRTERVSCAADEGELEAVVRAAVAEVARAAGAVSGAGAAVSAGAAAAAGSGVRSAASSASNSFRAFARFALGQARFIRKRVWAAQIVLVIGMVALCGMTEWMFPGAAAERTALLASLLGAVAVAVGLPDLMASRASGTEELEYACRFDCRAVMLARMILLGGSEVLAVTVAALAAPAVVGTSTFSLLLHACAPYFVSCLGCLALARRVSAQAALPAMAVWTALVMAASIALYGLTRTAYEAASVGAWALVAAVAAVLALREARRWLDQAAAGLDCLGAAKVHG